MIYFEDIAVDHRGTVRTMELNTRKAYTLTCNIKGNPRPVYQWMSTLTDLSNIHNQILLLQNNTHKNGISERIECFGLRTEFEEGQNTAHFNALYVRLDNFC